MVQLSRSLKSLALDYDLAVVVRHLYSFYTALTVFTLIKSNIKINNCFLRLFANCIDNL